MIRDRRQTHDTASSPRAGFSLMGLIIFLAVAAILAGALVPAYFRLVDEARENATLDEMEQLEQALDGFYRDTGRLPTEGEGLGAVMVDPAVAGWHGPYVETLDENPVTAVTTDAWGRPYAYDVAPSFDSAETAAALVVSGGRDRTIAMGAVGGTWSWASTADDLRRQVETASADRILDEESAAEIEVIIAAAQDYFRDRQQYPTTLTSLQDAYLDPGVTDDRLEDGWHRTYLLSADNGAIPPTLQIRSRGPDGVDDAGGGDDLVRNVDSAAPGRRATLHEIHIAQAVLDADPGLTLTGVWAAERANLGLDAFLDEDGWNKAYEVQVSTRTVLSAGPDGDYDTPGDNIPPGVVPDDAATGDPIVYIDGSGESYGTKCQSIRFDITNESGAGVTITTLKVSWPEPTAWYKRIDIDGVARFNQPNDRAATGQVVTLSPSYTLPAGATVTIKVRDFRDQRSAGAKLMEMEGKDFTIEFPDGTVISFEAEDC